MHLPRHHSLPLFPSACMSSPSLPHRPFYCSSSLIVVLDRRNSPISFPLSRPFPSSLSSACEESSRATCAPKRGVSFLRPFTLFPFFPLLFYRYRCSPMVASSSPSRGISRRCTFRIACYYICRVRVSVACCEGGEISSGSTRGWRLTERSVRAIIRHIGTGILV